MDSKAEAAAGGNGGVGIDTVVIDGAEYRVRQEIADEIVNVRRGVTHEILERVRAIEPDEGETIVITVPGAASVEFQSQVAEVVKLSFPRHAVAVLPESLGLHTVAGLKDLVQVGMEMAVAVQENAPHAAKSKADAFVALVSARDDE